MGQEEFNKEDKGREGQMTEYNGGQLTLKTFQNHMEIYYCRNFLKYIHAPV